MGAKYQCHKECFGPAIAREDEDDLIKKKRDTKFITKVYQHILEKFKEIRQRFSKAVNSGALSRSEEIIYEHFEKLKQIWGGLPNIEPMPNSTNSNFVNFNVSAENRTFMSIVEGDRIEITASNTIGVTNINDDQNTSGVINHDKN